MLLGVAINPPLQHPLKETRGRGDKVDRGPTEEMRNLKLRTSAGGCKDAKTGLEPLCSNDL